MSSSIYDHRRLFVAGIFLFLGIRVSTLTTNQTDGVMFSPDNAATVPSTSHNWAGYSAANGSFTSVTGMWTIPRISNTGHSAADASWVGIGGLTGHDLIQSGTQDIVNSSGQVSTTAFIEMLPRGAQQIPVTVNPGDTVGVAIARQSSNTWQISFRDATSGQTYNTTVPYNSSLSSADWIEEDPSSRGRLLPLDNFGTIQFSGGLATENGNSVTIAQANGQAITLIDAYCQAAALPSALGGDGQSFSVTRTVTETTPVSYPYGDDGGWRRDGQGIGQSNPYPRGYGNCPSTPSGPGPTPSTPTVPWTRPLPFYWIWRSPFFGRGGSR